MAGRATAFRFKPNGEPLGTLHYSDCAHTEGLDGIDKLECTAYDDVRRGERIAWVDDGGTWHEHIVGTARRVHSKGKPQTQFSTYNSVGETWGWVADGTKRTGTVGEILAWLLKDTRWVSDGSDISGTYELETYHKQVRQCLAELCELCGGELETRILANGEGIYSRKVAILAQRGLRTPSRQFTYGRGMAGVTREEDDSQTVYTAVAGYGKILDGQEGDYPDRLTFASINDGNPYVVNADALAWWGCIGNDGVMHHTCTTYTDDACTDAAFLKAQTQRVLANVSTPPVTYEMDLPRMDDGADMLKLFIGDVINVVDEEMGMAFQERVTSITRKFDGKVSGKVTIGKKPNLIVEKFKAEEKTAQKSTGNTTRAASSSPTVTTKGVYGGSGYGGGDHITHTLDGVTITSGTIAFTTVSEESE